MQYFTLTILFDRRTILDSHSEDYLRTCRFNASHPEDKLCPVFRLQTIVEEANEEFDEMAIEVSTIWSLNNLCCITFVRHCTIKLGVKSCL